MCTPHELAEVEALPQQERNPRLLRLWTLKEACSKALGVGLAARFTDFGFSTDEHGRPALHGRPSGHARGFGPATGGWAFHTFTVGSRYVAAVALHDCRPAQPGLKPAGAH